MFLFKPFQSILISFFMRLFLLISLNLFFIHTTDRRLLQHSQDNIVRINNPIRNSASPSNENFFEKIPRFSDEPSDSLGKDRKDGWSLFTILIVTFLVFFFFYCVGGILYNSIVENKPIGFALLPHANFWIKVIKINRHAEVIDLVEVVYEDNPDNAEGMGYFGIDK